MLAPFQQSSSSSPPTSEVVAHHEEWIGCALCGRPEDTNRVHVVSTGSGSRSKCHKAKTCTTCTEDFWRAHLPTSSPEEHMPNRSVWTYRTKCIAVRQLLHGEGIDSQNANNLSGRRLDAQEFKKSFETLSTLKNQLSELYKLLSDITTEKRSDPVAIVDSIKDCVKRFDAFMRDLDALYSNEFNSKLLRYVTEFHEKDLLLACEAPLLSDPAAEENTQKTDGNNNNNKSTTSLSETEMAAAVAAAKLLENIKALLRTLVQNMPMNKMLYQNRELLKDVLGLEKYSNDKFVLTLDGGGIKGVLTVHVLRAIRDRLRLKTGIKDLRITDCFDLAVGTSTGGIIVGCMCAVGMDLEAILELYTTLGHKVFGEDNKTDLRYSIAARYADSPILRIMLDIFGTKRLDDVGIAFDAQKSTSGVHSGPDSIRFGFTAVDLSASHPQTILFRNYQKEIDAIKDSGSVDDKIASGIGIAKVKGTDQCFIAEAVRCTSSPPGIMHPYARFYAPLENHVKPWMLTSSTRYRRRSSNKKVIYTNAEILLDQVADENAREQLRVRMGQDKLMQGGMVGVDGGLAANNPAVLALNEARLLCQGASGCGIRVLSIGTGRLPVGPNATWNKKYPTPLDHGVTGKDSYRDVIADLFKYSYIYAATETEEATQTMDQFGSMLASYRRVNPDLSRVVDLDDTSDAAIRILTESANVWIGSTQGQETIESVSEEILNNSMRLRRRLEKIVSNTN